MTDPGLAIKTFAGVHADEGEIASFAVPTWSEDDWKKLFAHARPVTLRAGDVLIRRNAVERALYLVASGLVEVLGDDPAQRGKPIARIGPGAVVGEIAFLDAGPRTATVIAGTECDLWKLEYEDYERFVATCPRAACDFALALGRVLAQRVRRQG